MIFDKGFGCPEDRKSVKKLLGAGMLIEAFRGGATLAGLFI